MAALACALLVSSEQSTKLGKAQAHRRRVNALRRKLAEAELAKATVEEELEAVGATATSVLSRTWLM